MVGVGATPSATCDLASDQPEPCVLTVLDGHGLGVLCAGLRRPELFHCPGNVRAYLQTPALCHQQAIRMRALNSDFFRSFFYFIELDAQTQTLSSLLLHYFMCSQIIRHHIIILCSLTYRINITLWADGPRTNVKCQLLKDQH